MVPFSIKIEKVKDIPSIKSLPIIYIISSSKENKCVSSKEMYEVTAADWGQSRLSYSNPLEMAKLQQHASFCFLGWSFASPLVKFWHVELICLLDNQRETVNVNCVFRVKQRKHNPQAITVKSVVAEWKQLLTTGKQRAWLCSNKHVPHWNLNFVGYSCVKNP